MTHICVGKINQYWFRLWPVACLGAKPLSEPMLIYCCLDSVNKFQGNWNKNAKLFIQENAFENVVCEMATIFSQPQYVKSSLHKPLHCCIWYCVIFHRVKTVSEVSWWRHQMETFSALLAICAGNSPVHGEFPAQRPVTRNFDVYFDMHPNNRLSKQSWGWWFETQSRPLWRHRNDVDSTMSQWWSETGPRSIGPVSSQFWLVTTF